MDCRAALARTTRTVIAKPEWLWRSILSRQYKTGPYGQAIERLEKDMMLTGPLRPFRALENASHYRLHEERKRRDDPVSNFLLLLNSH